jgi:hypothetical protein
VSVKKRDETVKRRGQRSRLCMNLFLSYLWKKGGDSQDIKWVESVLIWKQLTCLSGKAGKDRNSNEEKQFRDEIKSLRVYLIDLC